jgi:hypothetical protein
VVRDGGTRAAELSPNETRASQGGRRRGLTTSGLDALQILRGRWARHVSARVDLRGLTVKRGSLASSRERGSSVAFMSA